MTTNIIKNGKGTIVPGSGIHFVLSELTVYPSLHTILEGSHAVPDLSISYPNCHWRPASTHLLVSPKSVTNPLGHVVTQVKLANRYPAEVLQVSQYDDDPLQVRQPVSHPTH